METLQLQLGDIIQIDSPTDVKYNDNIYLTGPIEISFRGELSQRLSNLIK